MTLTYTLPTPLVSGPMTLDSYQDLMAYTGTKKENKGVYSSDNLMTPRRLISTIYSVGKNIKSVAPKDLTIV